MLVLLSPAKSMCNYRATQFVATCPVLLEKTDTLLGVMKGKSKGDLKVSLVCGTQTCITQHIFDNSNVLHCRLWWASVMILLRWTMTDISVLSIMNVAPRKMLYLTVINIPPARLLYLLALLQRKTLIILRLHLSSLMDLLIEGLMPQPSLLNSTIMLNRWGTFWPLL